MSASANPAALYSSYNKRSMAKAKKKNSNAATPPLIIRTDHHINHHARHSHIQPHRPGYLRQPAMFVKLLLVGPLQRKKNKRNDDPR